MIFFHWFLMLYFFTYLEKINIQTLEINLPFPPAKSTIQSFCITDSTIRYVDMPCLIRSILWFSAGTGMYLETQIKTNSGHILTDSFWFSSASVLWSPSLTVGKLIHWPMSLQVMCLIEEQEETLRKWAAARDTKTGD